MTGLDRKLQTRHDIKCKQRGNGHLIGSSLKHWTHEQRTPRV